MHDPTQALPVVLKRLETSEAGLTNAEALRRQDMYGSNELTQRRTSLWRRLLEPFASPFVMILLFSAGVSLWSGEQVETTVILAIIFLNATIFYVQQISTNRAVKALQIHDKHVVDVLREGQRSQIAASDLVPGDVMYLNEGQKVPADIRLMDVQQLSIDESILTGEVEPIRKNTKLVPPRTPLYKQHNMAFRGTIVVSGSALGVVARIGDLTELGMIAKLVEDTHNKSPIEEKIERLTRGIIYAVAAISVLVFVLALWRGIAPLLALRFVLSLAVSAVPEGLPVALTVVLIFGVRRMARKNALVRNMTAVETLGALTLIVTDKTGTITRNQLAVSSVVPAPRVSLVRLKEGIARALVQQNGMATDFLDKILADYSGERTTEGEEVVVFPFNQRLRMSGTVWRRGSQLGLFVKGAPEALLENAKMSGVEKQAVLKELETLASQGARLIGFARAQLTGVPKDLATAIKSGRLQYDGTVGLVDTIRPEVHAALKRVQEAGIQVVMLTGDHPKTAHHIGRQIGLVADAREVGEARSVHELSEAELFDHIRTKRAFARVLPEDKYAFVKKLKNRHVIAMTGDGVNDVPALVVADVGFAMGNGTDAAKEAGDIILLDNNFRTIADSVAEGRRIIANIQRMVMYLLSTNIGEVTVMIVALLAGLPLPITAIQILWINLVTDGLTVIPLGLEPATDRVMKQQPRSPQAPLLSRRRIALLVAISLNVAALTLGVYIWMLGLHPDLAQTYAFSVLVASQWAFTLVLRSDRATLGAALNLRNRPLWLVLLAAAGLQLLVIYGPLAPFFETRSLPVIEFATISFAVLIWNLLYGTLAKRIFLRA